MKALPRRVMGASSAPVSKARPIKPRGTRRPSAIRASTSYDMTRRPARISEISLCDCVVNVAIRRCEMHPNWKADATHPVFLLQFVTNDHVAPVAWGGESRDPGNIVTVQLDHR